MSILLHIDHRSKTPVFKQITRRVIDLINSEVLTPEEKLPPARTLAVQLGVNRSTVYKAYQELWALGYIESSPGSYSTVRSRARLVTDEDGCEPSLIDWHRQCRRKPCDLKRLILLRFYNELNFFNRKPVIHIPVSTFVDCKRFNFFCWI